MHERDTGAGEGEDGSEDVKRTLLCHYQEARRINMGIVMKDDGPHFVWRKFWMRVHVRFVSNLLVRKTRVLNFGFEKKRE